jgi:DNA ligase (NAD+)
MEMSHSGLVRMPGKYVGREPSGVRISPSPPFFCNMVFSTHKQEIDFLENLGFIVNPYNSVADNVDEIWEKGKQLHLQKETLAYPIDGLVVKTNNLKIVSEAGVVGKTPRAWSAIKFAPEEVVTEILGVTWQVGRTGKVTPVAELEPVELAGTTVKRATLHNYKEFLDSHLHMGDMLVIRKAGEIIPEVVAILDNLRKTDTDQFLVPIVCPHCTQNLTTSVTEIDLICTNSEHCPVQVKERLAYFCARNIGNIAGLSDKQIEKFIELYDISDIYDLYDLPLDEIRELDGFGVKSVENLQKSIEKSMEIQGYKFLAGLSIDGVGPEVARLICQKIYEEST